MQVKNKSNTGRRGAIHLPRPDDILRVRRGVLKAARTVFELERLYGYRPWRSEYDPQYNFKEPGLLHDALSAMRTAQDRLMDLFRLEAANEEDRGRRRKMERTAAQLLQAENVRVMPRLGVN